MDADILNSSFVEILLAKPPAIERSAFSDQQNAAERELASMRAYCTQTERSLVIWDEELANKQAEAVNSAVERIADPAEKLAAINRAIDQNNKMLEAQVLRINQIAALKAPRPKKGNPFAAQIKEMRDIHRRVLNAMAKQYERMEEYGDLLLAHRSDFNPESTGGPAFDDPKALLAFLKSA